MGIIYGFGAGHREDFEPVLASIRILRAYHGLGMRVIGHPVESCILPSASNVNCHVCYLAKAGIEMGNWIIDSDQGDSEWEWEDGEEEEEEEEEEDVYLQEVAEEIALSEHLEDLQLLEIDLE